MSTRLRCQSGLPHNTIYDFMGVKYESFLGGYTPICNSCGVAMCADISEVEYMEAREFWDGWRCEMCNPHAKFALARHLIKTQRYEHQT